MVKVGLPGWHRDQESACHSSDEHLGCFHVLAIINSVAMNTGVHVSLSKLWYIYTMGYYSAIKKNTSESVLMRWMKLEPIIQSEASQKEKHHKYTNAYIWNLERW